MEHFIAVDEIQDLTLAYHADEQVWNEYDCDQVKQAVVHAEVEVCSNQCVEEKNRDHYERINNLSAAYHW